ncbi:MAG: hypothetical protein Q4F67_01685 [Propionibacteriaceae bacterium]|nr:hypothetical protein [Propionibacteriaceae bacterium]
MRAFSAVTSLIISAVLSLSITFGFGPLESIKAPAAPAGHAVVSEVASSTHGYGVWICTWARIAFLCPVT